MSAASLKPGQGTPFDQAIAKGNGHRIATFDELLRGGRRCTGLPLRRHGDDAPDDDRNQAQPERHGARASADEGRHPRRAAVRAVRGGAVRRVQGGRAMIRYRIEPPGREPIVFLGLSVANVTRLRAGQPIRIKADDQIGLGVEVVIYLGATEVELARELEDHGLIPPSSTDKTEQAMQAHGARPTTEDEHTMSTEHSTEDLIDRAPGDDVIVAVRMRRSSFEKLTSTPDGRSVPVTEGMIGLVPDEPSTAAFTPDGVVWTFTVWSGEPVWRGVPEQIPGNQNAADARKPVDMRYLTPDDEY